MSIASAHFARVRAEREAEAAAAAPALAGIPGTQAEKMLALLAMHRAALKGIQSRVAKIAKKGEYLPEYAAYVDGVLAADGGAQDDVVTTVMLWRLDTGDYAGALEIAAYAVRHGLAMPEYITRDLPTTVVEEIADAALATPGEDFAEPLNTILDLTAECDMPDEVRAKAHKALGLIDKDSDPAKAAEHLETALSLDAKCGVKTELARLKKALAAEAGS
jgi:hypothetical protein